MTGTVRRSDAQATEPAVLVDDRFLDHAPPGTVVGSRATSGAPRLGVDAEATMGVDGGALRIRPLARPGWGREGLAYGPFRRRAGLALAAHVLNGHNASQTFYEPETLRRRARRVVGDLRRGRLRRPKHFENLAVGWFTAPAPRDPLAGGNGFVMHALDGDNGELWVTSSGRPLRSTRGVQNVEIQYVVVLRERGAAYYAAAAAGAQGLGAHPHMRPLGIDHADRSPWLWPGIHQRILGEVGYRVDTRVQRVRVAEVPDLARWYGTAQVADRLLHHGLDAEVGGRWQPWAGAPSGRTGAVIPAPVPSGLVHVLVDLGRPAAPAGVLVRVDDREGWSIELGPHACTLSVHDRAGAHVVATDRTLQARPGRSHAVQVLDDGQRLSVHVDGRLAFGGAVDDPRLGGNTGVGYLRDPGPGATVRDFEAHARAVPIPGPLDLGPPWDRAGDHDVLVEGFDGEPGDLDGAPTSDGSRRWRRRIGVGSIRRTGGGAARVDASPDRPNPGRTAYTVPWDDPAFADVQVELVPPGTGRGQGHEHRGGVVLWQDPDNYVVLNLFLDNVYDGSSISTFYRLDGHEDMYDAVWSLVGPVRWGVPCTLRVASDGARFLAHLDGRPVLYRALRDVYPWARSIEIREIGLVANEEWGDDTGTEFRRFVVRGRREGTGP